jgi:hypothetical protein
MAGKSSKKASLPDIINKEMVVAYWPDAVAALTQAGRVLSVYCGAALDGHSQDFLAYAPILPPLAAVLSKYPIEGAGTEQRIDRIKKLKIWYFAAALHSYYSEGTDNKQSNDAREFSNWFASASLQATQPSLLTAGISRPSLDVQKTSALGKSLLSLLNLQKPKDWYEDGKTVGRGDGRAPSDLHHIFPTAALVRKTKTERSLSQQDAEILVRKELKSDTVLNLTWLLDTTNREIIKDDLPSVYLPRLEAHVGGPAALGRLMGDHLISSEALTCLRTGNWQGFLLARERTFYEQLVTFGVAVASVNAQVASEDSMPDGDET